MREICWFIEGQTFPDVEGENPQQAVYRTASTTNLRVTGLWLRLEDGERNVIPFKLTQSGKTILVVPQVEGSDSHPVQFRPLPVDNGGALAIETLELPKIRPVRAWGTIWMEVDD